MDLPGSEVPSVSEVPQRTGPAPSWLGPVYRARNGLDSVVIAVAVTLFSAATVLTFVGTLSRAFSVLPDLTWAPEFTRYAIIVSVLLVAPMGMRRGTQISVGILLDAAPRPVFRALTVVNNILMLGLFAVVAFYGFKVAELNASQLSPLLGISLRDLYLVVSLSGLLLTFEATLRIVEAFVDTAPRPSETESMMIVAE